jgi:hypothetical protein
MTGGAVGAETFKHRFSITPQDRRKKPKNVKWARPELTAECIESPDRPDALIGAIMLGQEAKIDWKQLLEDQKRIKRQMQFGIGCNAIFPRRHIEWWR